MAKAIFTTKAGSGYDDRREERYHFPQTYLNQVRAAIGDYIIYYEPRRSDVGSTGRQAYFATARVTDVVEDRKLPGHYYAFVSEYLDFEHPVRFSEDSFYYESALRKDDGSTNKGAFGRSVRTIPEQEFDLILKSGFAVELTATSEAVRPDAGFEEPDDEFVRPIIERTVARPFRERAFMIAVRAAYQNTCSMTGLCLINGGGRPEVQAAHIKPVASNGPDAIRNGLALSGTFHWLFDRGLISIADDYRILVNEKVPDQARRMLNPSGKLILPNEEALYPTPHYLTFHRENIFKS
jgi:putative restriction endonuclease